MSKGRTNLEHMLEAGMLVMVLDFLISNVGALQYSWRFDFYNHYWERTPLMLFYAKAGFPSSENPDSRY